MDTGKWNCSKCGREFKKTGQPHSCHKVPLNEHFVNKEKARKIFDYLVKKIGDDIGKVKIISLPCCIHLYGTSDFLAALPKRNSLEVRIGLNRKINSPNLIQSVPVSAKSFKNCFEISSEKEIDSEFMKWIKEAYLI